MGGGRRCGRGRPRKWPNIITATSCEGKGKVRRSSGHGPTAVDKAEEGRYRLRYSLHLLHTCACDDQTPTRTPRRSPAVARCRLDAGTSEVADGRRLHAVYMAPLPLHLARTRYPRGWQWQRWWRLGDLPLIGIRSFDDLSRALG